MAAGPQLFYCLWQDSRIRDTLFEELSKEDICNVRLANSACCNLVTKRLFIRTHLTFTPNSFTRPTRIQALSRIGHYIEHLTFYLPHSNATFLPPLIHPQSGREISFLYTPHTSMGSVLERPKFSNEGLGEILTSQYPPLFHAASNVPSFINAMKHLTNIRHLTIKTPGQNPSERYRRDIVDYALISLRVAIERAPMKKLNKLSLCVHPSAFLYLRSVQGFGCSPSAGRRWRQIRKMSINVDSWDFYGPSPGLDHLKIIQDYLNNYSTSLEKLSFTWHGRKGPCPIALAADPLFAPPRNSLKLFREVTSPMSPLPPVPPRKPVVFRKLRYLAIRNTTMNSAQVADLVASHQNCVREFDFENSVLISDGNWDDALAPLMKNNSRGGYWTRHSMATVTEITSVRSRSPPRLQDVYESEPSAAVAAVARQLYNIDNDGVDGVDGVVEYNENYEKHEVELDSDVEAARQASLSYTNKIKKRTVTKRRRKRKPSHERHREDKGEHRHHHHHRGRQHRGRHRQTGSHGSLEEPHEPPKRSREPPQLTTPPQPPFGGLFGEVDSVYSTDSRRLFGEITPLPRSRSGSEPDLSHSPSDDPDSGDDYFRPQTPKTPEMKISAPILDTSPQMPTLLQPKVYDPTAELCSEITAVQRDIEAEEKHRRVAEDAEMQTSALRRAKELVLTRLGKEFGANNYGANAGGRLSPKKESFGASAFLSSARFREGLFGKGNGYPSCASVLLYASYKLADTLWLYARPSTLHRYLYTDDATGQRAWALITGASNGIGKCLAFELAAAGFNVVLHGRNPAKLDAVRRELEARDLGVEVRILVADASQCHRAEEVDFARIRDEMAGLHLTVLINCAGCGPKPAFGALEAYGREDILDTLHLNAAFPTLLTAALLPVLKGEYKVDRKMNGHICNGNGNGHAIGPTTRAGAGLGASDRCGSGSGSGSGRGKRALIINIGSVTDEGFPLVSFYSAGKAAGHALHNALAREAALFRDTQTPSPSHTTPGTEIEVVSHRVGAVTEVSHTQAPPSFFRPAARTIARAVLARTGCGRKSVVPYWPHALLHGVLGALPAGVVDRVVNAAMREEIRAQEEEAKKGL
ncbi:hypothetical protein F5Y10DRAFT_281348 [Nemania abortiva]|nr:hypothetical protein F5Y10DRAFT_281348 [Nemania abortiva]